MPTQVLSQIEHVYNETVSRGKQKATMIMNRTQEVDRSLSLCNDYKAAVNEVVELMGSRVSKMSEAMNQAIRTKERSLQSRIQRYTEENNAKIQKYEETNLKHRADLVGMYKKAQVTLANPDKYAFIQGSADFEEELDSWILKELAVPIRLEEDPGELDIEASVQQLQQVNFGASGSLIESSNGATSGTMTRDSAEWQEEKRKLMRQAADIFGAREKELLEQIEILQSETPKSDADILLIFQGEKKQLQQEKKQLQQENRMLQGRVAALEAEAARHLEEGSSPVALEGELKSLHASVMAENETSDLAVSDYEEEEEEHHLDDEIPEPKQEDVTALLVSAQGRKTPSERDSIEQPEEVPVHRPQPGQTSGRITPRERASSNVSAPADTAGWLWKKAGGGDKAGTSFSLTGRNWKKRWFTLKGSILAYYEHASGPDGKFMAGQGKPLWSGDLRVAKVTPAGDLLANLKYEDAKNRTVLEVNFKDRLLRLGTSPGDQNQSDRTVLQYWHEALNKHHKFVTSASPAIPPSQRG